MKTMTVPAALRAEAAGWRTIPAAAGIIYALAWVSGLLIAPASLRVTASGTEVVSAYAGHQAPAIAQVMLTEGVAGLALAAVVVALSRAARGHGHCRAATGQRLAVCSNSGTSTEPHLPFQLMDHPSLVFRRRVRWFAEAGSKC